ncbi:MAG: Response regulator receiver domain, partial [Verrucomicrobiales bacterium]|nr:Response regulator receiver domain [Verrucomicrobiales bacterium]
YNLGVVHSGMELLSTIHHEARTSCVPVIVYCGDKFEELIIQAYEAGADYFLEKPDRYNDLIRMVRCLDECLKSTPIHLEGVRELPEYQPAMPFPSWRGLRRLV